MPQVQGILATISFLDILDIAIVAYVLYRMYYMIKDTRAVALLKGLFVLLAATALRETRIRPPPWSDRRPGWSVGKRARAGKGQRLSRRRLTADICTLASAAPAIPRHVGADRQTAL